MHIGEALNMDELVAKSEVEDGAKFYKDTFHVEKKPRTSGALCVRLYVH